MKLKILSMLLCILMLLSVFNLYAFAAEERTGISFNFTTTNGITHPEEFYYSKKKLEEIPRTIEAWVYIPQSSYSSSIGLVVSTRKSVFDKDDFIELSIAANGIPNLKVGRGDSLASLTHTFTDAKIPADKWTHLAVVYGTGSKGKQVYCYIDGSLKASSSTGNYVELNEKIFDNYLCIGGNVPAFNSEGFRGILGDIRIYSDARSAKEVAGDMINPPNLKDMSLMMNFEISSDMKGKTIVDTTGYGYDMTYGKVWLNEEEMEAIRNADGNKYTYSIAVLPDVQYMTEKWENRLAGVFDYLLENAESKNIQYVLGMGDMTNKNKESEWQRIKKQTDRLNGVIPYAMIRGNHDVTKNNFAELFDKYYSGADDYYYQHVMKNGGFMDETSTKNTYLLFSVGKVDYLLLNLDWGANDEILAWADKILNKYSDRRAIITTHGYLYEGGRWQDGNTSGSPDSYSPAAGQPEWNSGEAMWDKCFKKHENVYMVLCGHAHFSDIVVYPDKGDAGNTVYQILMDQQSTCNALGGGGFVNMMYFTEDGNHVRIENYSTAYGKYFSTITNTITLDLSRGSDEAEPSVTTVATTAAQATDQATAEEPLVDGEAEKKGCGGSVAFVFPATVAVLTSVVAVSGGIKKKKSVKRIFK